jgi:enoyl-CoA hydratase
MEMVLTGEPMKANEALQRGLVSRVVPPEKCLEDAIELAKKIAAMPRLICKFILLNILSYQLQRCC